jgi:hypothetical protein
LEASSLNLDAGKAKKELNWNSSWTQAESIDKSYEWWFSVLSLGTSPLVACTRDIELFLNSK